MLLSDVLAPVEECIDENPVCVQSAPIDVMDFTIDHSFVLEEQTVNQESFDIIDDLVCIQVPRIAL